MTYQVGDRVALEYIDDEDTELRPGDHGTVAGYDPRMRILDVDWDRGPRTAMRLGGADRVRTLDQPAPAQPDPDTSIRSPRDPEAGHRWQQLLDAMAHAGADAGRDAADRWAQDTVGGRAHGDVAATARRVLAGLDDGDPAILDALPAVNPLDGARYTESVADGAPAWEALRGADRDAVQEAYRDGYDTALQNRVAEHCRAAGGGWAHLHPDNLRLGSVGVFAGDWAWTSDGAGDSRMPVGFVGVLIDTWNGWAVFSCTRQVAEAIVADQQRVRDDLRQEYLARGVDSAGADRAVDESTGRMVFDGDTITVDERACYGDEDAVERIGPDGEGRYVVMGWSWTWTAVDPADCDRIVGDLPAPGASQQFVVLPHTGLRVPHERLRVTGLGRTVTPAGVSYRAAVAWDGEPAGTIVNDGTGGPSTLKPAIPSRIRRFLDDCRHGGRPASDGQILDCLVEEYRWARQVAAAAADGGALARLIDEGGEILTSLEVWPAPRNPVARMDVGLQIAAGHQDPRGVQWQIWDGTAWQHLAAARPATGSPAWYDTGDGPANPMAVIAYLIADGLLERLDRDQLIDHAADTGVLLTPSMSDPQLRAAIRYDKMRRAREAGVPVDDLPTLTADQAIELGRIASGGSPADAGSTGPQQL